MKDYSDFELIKLIRDKDDKHAFELLYNKYWDKLFKTALSKVYDEDEVSDIVQDLFITIWVRRQELNIHNNVDLYLFRSLKNRIINFYKKKYLTDDNVNEFAKNTPNKTDSDAEIICSYKEVELVIKNEMDRLPGKMKQIFLLSRDEQLSSKKISEMLSISDQTVRNQISKAIKRIKISIEKYNGSG